MKRRLGLALLGQRSDEGWQGLKPCSSEPRLKKKRSQGREPEEALEKLWAGAEQAFTQAGYGLAAFLGAEANGMENVLAGVTEGYRYKTEAEMSTGSYILPSSITPSPESYAAGFATVRYVSTQCSFNPFAPC